MASNGSLKQRHPDQSTSNDIKSAVKDGVDALSKNVPAGQKDTQTTANLLICVGGIYASLYGCLYSPDKWTVY